jgi:hypothetical protein
MSPHPVMIGQIVSEAEIDRSLIKIILVGILTIAASFGFAYFFNLSLITLQFRFLPLTIILAVAVLVLIILSIFYIKSFAKLTAIVFLSGVAVLAIFYPDFPLLAIIGSAVFFIILLSAYRRGSRMISNSLRLRFFLVAVSIVPRAVTAFLLFAALVFFNYYFDIDANRFNDDLNKIFISSIVKTSEPAIKIALPDFSAQNTGDEVLRAVLKKQIGNLVPDFDRYLPAVQERIFNESFADFKKNIEQQIGPIEGSRPFTETLRSLIKSYLDGFSDTGRLVFAIAFTFVLFFIIKGIAAIFYWLIELIAFILFKASIAAGFAYVSLENRSREFVALT